MPFAGDSSEALGNVAVINFYGDESFVNVWLTLTAGTHRNNTSPRLTKSVCIFSLGLSEAIRTFPNLTSILRSLKCTNISKAI